MNGIAESVREPDEILLGLMTTLFASWKARVPEPGGTSAEPAARKPATERVMLVPARAMATTAAAGAKSAIQAAGIIRARS